MNPENTIKMNDGLDDLFVHVDVKEEESEKITSFSYC